MGGRRRRVPPVDDKSEVYLWKGAPKAHWGNVTSSASTREMSSAMTGRFHNDREVPQGAMARMQVVRGIAHASVGWILDDEFRSGLPRREEDSGGAVDDSVGTAHLTDATGGKVR